MSEKKSRQKMTTKDDHELGQRTTHVEEGQRGQRPGEQGKFQPKPKPPRPPEAPKKQG